MSDGNSGRLDVFCCGWRGCAAALLGWALGASRWDWLRQKALALERGRGKSWHWARRSRLGSLCCLGFGSEGGLSIVLAQAWELKEEGASLPVRTLHPQAATHHLCEAATEVEPQASAANRTGF